jgi:hypothetical protein
MHPLPHLKGASQTDLQLYSQRQEEAQEEEE